MEKDKTQWFKDSRWGIFVHYLDTVQNGENVPNNSRFEKTSWNECVNDFDVELFARQMEEIGAGYVFLTLCQGSRFLCAPNAYFDRLTGYRPGEACSERDLPMELADALAKYRIPLMLYFTGDGPKLDETAGRAFGTIDGVNPDVKEEFVRKWAEVMKEYAVRYGKKVRGWWIDGCFDYFGYRDELLKPYRDAALAGNEDAIIAFNDGVVKIDYSVPEIAKMTAGAKRATDKRAVVDAEARKGNPAAQKALLEGDTPKKARYSRYEDYTAGESSYLKEIPEQRFADGSQWHALSFLGIGSNMPLWSVECGWACPGSRYSGPELKAYLDKVGAGGGVVSLDVFVRRDGRLDQGQLEVLKYLKKR